MPHRSACQPLAPSFPHTWRPWGTWTSPLGAASRPLTGESTPPFSSYETGTQIGCCCSASHQPLPTWLPTAPIKVRNGLLLGKRLTYCQWWGPSATEQNWTNHHEDWPQCARGLTAESNRSSVKGKEQLRSAGEQNQWMQDVQTGVTRARCWALRRGFDSFLSLFWQRFSAVSYRSKCSLHIEHSTFMKLLEINIICRKWRCERQL